MSSWADEAAKEGVTRLVSSSGKVSTGKVSPAQLTASYLRSRGFHSALPAKRIALDHQVSRGRISFTEP